MESSSIELKVISCKDLKAFNFFQKLSVYALVSIVSDDPNKKLEKNKQQRTSTDREGDGNPEWNHEMRFDQDDTLLQDCDHLFLHFDLRFEVVVFGDKTIGEVRVPFKDLMDESNGVVRFVSYEVRNTDGKPNGVLNFSYKLNSKGNKIGVDSAGTKIDGFSTVHHHHHHHHHNHNHNPSPEIHYPTPEVHSPSSSTVHHHHQSQNPSPEVHSPSSSEVHYPLLELLNPSSQETYSAPQEVHYHSAELQHTSHETYYSPPPPPWVHPPPPPPPPPGPFYPLWVPDPYSGFGEERDGYPSFRKNGRLEIIGSSLDPGDFSSPRTQ